MGGRLCESRIELLSNGFCRGFRTADPHRRPEKRKES